LPATNGRDTIRLFQRQSRRPKGRRGFLCFVGCFAALDPGANVFGCIANKARAKFDGRQFAPTLCPNDGPDVARCHLGHIFAGDQVGKLNSMKPVWIELC